LKTKHDDKLADYFANPTLLDRTEEFCSGVQQTAVPTLVSAGFVAVSQFGQWAYSAVQGAANAPAACNAAGAVVAAGTAAAVGLGGYLFVGDNFPTIDRPVMRKLGAAFTILAATGLGFVTADKLKQAFGTQPAASAAAPAAKYDYVFGPCAAQPVPASAPAASCTFLRP